MDTQKNDVFFFFGGLIRLILIKDEPSHRIFSEVRSFDSLQYFPESSTSCFSEMGRFEGLYEQGLMDISVM